LSPLGEKIAKLEKLSSDVEYLVAQMKNSAVHKVSYEDAVQQQSTQEYH
jgi:hypothetical protein